MTVTDTQSATMSKLASMGFGVTHMYNDGIVRMRQIGTEIAVFVRQDGTVSPPHTADTRLVGVLIREIGIEVTS